MKIAKLLIVSLFLLTLFTLGAVSASEDTSDVNMAANDDLNIESSVIDSVNIEHDCLETNFDAKLSTGNGNFSELNELIENSAANDEIKLEKNYCYSDASDSSFKNGINISKTITINGQGNVIDGNSQAGIFNIMANNVVLKNITIVNASKNTFDITGKSCNIMNCNIKNSDHISFSYDNTGSINGCRFTNCISNDESLIDIQKGIILNSEFINCSCTHDTVIGGIIYIREGAIVNCSFSNCSSNSNNVDGGAINAESTSIINCKFADCSDNSKWIYGGAIYARNCNITNCTFTRGSNNCEDVYGGAIYASDLTNISKCVFISCNKAIDGASSVVNSTFSECSGCIYSADDVNNCSFSECSGCIYSAGDVNNCSFNKCGEDCVYISSRGSINNCNFIECVAAGHDEESGDESAIIHFSNTKGTINNCNFTKSTNVIYLDRSTANITSCDYINCSSAISISKGSSNCLENCIFKNCSSSYGGAVYISSGSNNIKNCSFTDCSANNQGGAIYITGSKNTIKDCEFIRCSAASGGGVIYLTGTNGEIADSSFINSTSFNGGVIYWNGKNGTVKNSSFENSKASANGGAIYWNGADGKIEKSNFTYSNAKNGGGVYVTGDNNVEVISSIFKNNTAENIASAIYGGSISNCTFNENSYPETYSTNQSKLESQTTLTVNTTSILYKQGISITATVANKDGSKISGSVSLYANNKLIGKSSSGEAFIYTPTAAGNYSIAAKFAGDSFYKSSETSNAMFSVGKITPQISIAGGNITYGETEVVNVALPSDVKGNITLNIIKGNEAIITTTIPSKGSITPCGFEGLEVGSYIASALFNGDSNYYSNSANATFEVFKAATKINIRVGDIFYGQREVINVTLPSDATGNVSYTIFKGESIIASETCELDEGVALCAFTGFNIGICNVKIQYDGDSNYNGSSANSEFIIRPNVNITQNAAVGDTVEITMDLVDASGQIEVFIDGKLATLGYIISNKFKTTLPTDAFAYGNHTVTFEYLGDSFDKNIFNYWDNKTNSYLPFNYYMNLIPIDITLPDNVGSNEEGVLTLEVPEDATGTIDVYVLLDGYVEEIKYAVVEIINGVARIDLSQFKDGSYKITLKYSGDNKYAPFTKQSVAQVHNNAPALIAANNLNMLYTSGATYQAIILTKTGKALSGVTVSFLINGKAYSNVKTDSNGVARTVISANPGSYTITSKVEGISVAKSLNVNHIVSLKKVTVKKSAKKLVLTATLAKVNGKYLKSQKITFKFNGKKYSAKTNKKGIAKVTIKQNVLKKLKVGKKVTYQATYLKDSAKNSVKVKK